MEDRHVTLTVRSAVNGKSISGLAARPALAAELDKHVRLIIYLRAPNAPRDKRVGHCRIQGPTRQRAICHNPEPRLERVAMKNAVGGYALIDVCLYHVFI